MVNAEPQVIITNDNLNATVDAQVYFKVSSDENSVKSSLYILHSRKFIPRNPQKHWRISK